MTFARISFVLALTLVCATGADAQPREAGGTDSAGPVVATSIPPNCTLNPFTNKMTCHRWPKGTKSRA